jgi:hypothetical protein
MALANDNHSITTMTDRLRTNMRFRFIGAHPSLRGGFVARIFLLDKLRRGLQFPNNEVLAKLQARRLLVNTPSGCHRESRHSFKTNHRAST